MDPRENTSMETETKKISMTITVKTENWLETTYPEAQSTQEAIRMAVSDARKHNSAVNSLAITNDD